MEISGFILKFHMTFIEILESYWEPLASFMASAQTDSTDEISKLFEISWRPDER